MEMCTGSVGIRNISIHLKNLIQVQAKQRTFRFLINKRKRNKLRSIGMKRKKYSKMRPLLEKKESRISLTFSNMTHLGQSLISIQRSLINQSKHLSQMNVSSFQRFITFMLTLESKDSYRMNLKLIDSGDCLMNTLKE
jgi:hypothetical protein